MRRVMRRFGAGWRGSGRVLSLIVAIAAVATPTLTAAQEADDRFAEVRSYVERTMAESGLPSLAIGVARNGEILWEEGFGWADRSSRRAATPHTMYSLASISKPITATAILRLAEQGRIDLDRSVNDYLGLDRVRSGAGDAAEVTVRRVLSHTAGLPLHYQFFYGGDGYGPPASEVTLDRYAIPVFPPGEVYQYSNLGYGLLDHLITRVSGKSYADYLRSELFVPLGMHRTVVDTGPGPDRFSAVRYDAESGAALPDYDFDHRGASAVYASVHDLLRFGLFHLGAGPDLPSVLSPEARRSMRRRHTPERGDGSGAGYGLGWAVDPSHFGLRAVSHSGGMPGVRTILRLFPEEDLVVAVLTNTSDNAVFEIADRLTASLVPSFARELERARESAESDDDGDAADEGFRPPPGLVGTWSGTLWTWEDSIPARLRVQDDGDVHLELEDQLIALVNRPSFEDGHFTGRAAVRIPTRDAERWRHSVLLRLRRSGASLRGSATAQTTERPIHFALSSYLALTRKEED